MVGAHEAHGEAALVRGAACVHWIELLEPFAGEPHAQVVIGDDGSAGRLRDLKGVAHVIAVGQHDMGDALDRRLPVRNEGGVSGEERIDQHGVAGEIEPEGGVAKPGDLHDGHPLRVRETGSAGT
jgi:hypothetical protein